MPRRYPRKGRYSRRNPPPGWRETIPPKPEDYPSTGPAAWQRWKRPPRDQRLLAMPIPYIEKFNPGSFLKLAKAVYEKTWPTKLFKNLQESYDDHDDRDIHDLFTIWCLFGTDWAGWLSVIERVGLHAATEWLPSCADQMAYTAPQKMPRSHKGPLPKPKLVTSGGLWYRDHEGKPVAYHGLKEYLLSYKSADLKLLRKAVKNWPYLTAEERRLAPNKLADAVYRKAVEALATSGASTAPGLMQEAIEAGVPVKKYLDIERRWLKGLHVQAKYGNPEGDIPFVEASEGPYRMYRLKKSDPRDIFLGEHTDCCQHPGGEGDDAAWYGHEEENAAFFVVEDTRDGKILAQSFVWSPNDVTDEGEDFGIVFDSLEVALGYRDGQKKEEQKPDAQKVRDIIKRLYDSVAQQLADYFSEPTAVNMGEYEKLDVGEDLWPAAGAIPEPDDLEYTDADEGQYHLAGPRLAGGAITAEMLDGTVFDVTSSEQIYWHTTVEELANGGHQNLQDIYGTFSGYDAFEWAREHAEYEDEDDLIEGVQSWGSELAEAVEKGLEKDEEDDTEDTVDALRSATAAAYEAGAEKAYADALQDVFYNGADVTLTVEISSRDDTETLELEATIDAFSWDSAYDGNVTVKIDGGLDTLNETAQDEDFRVGRDDVLGVDIIDNNLDTYADPGVEFDDNAYEDTLREELRALGLL